MTADSTASSSAAGGGAAVAANNEEGGRKKKVDPVTAVQDGVDGLALSLFEALRGARDAAVPPSTAVVVDDPSSASALPPPSSSAFLRETTEEDHHRHRTTATTTTTTLAAMGGEDGEGDDAAAVAYAKARLLSGLNVGYFSSRAYDPLDPDYESFLLAYLGDDTHAREMVGMMMMGGTTTGGDGTGGVVVERLPDASSSSSSSLPHDDGPGPGPGGGGGVVVGDVGYEFRKEFSSGWYVGRVIEIRPLAGEYRGAEKHTYPLAVILLCFGCVCARGGNNSHLISFLVVPPPFDVSFIVSLKRMDTTGGVCTPTETSRI
jgi:hypothetical protein